MKAHKGLFLAISIAVITFGESVYAQQCYTPVIGWGPDAHGNPSQYSFTAGGSAPCMNNGTCDIDQSASAKVNLANPGVTCSTLAWGSVDSNFSVSLNDKDTYACNTGGNSTETLSSTSGLFSDSTLGLNLSSSTYTFGNVSYANAMDTNCDCGSCSTKTVPNPIAPLSNFPLTLSLPSTVQPLTQSSYPLTAEADLGATVGWTINFTLNPIYNPDDCQQPGNSTIGCQTQSLGEGVPIVGTGFVLHYQSNRAPGAYANAVAEADAAMIAGWTLSVHHAYDPSTHTVFLGDGTQRKGSDLGNPVSFNGNLLLTSEDGSEVYVFSSSGRHLQTLRPMTGAVKYTFGYDSAGMLITVTDATGNVTTIQRNASEQPTAIVSPYGQTTTLTVDVNGFLGQVTDPLGKSSTFVNSSTGLLTSRTDPNGNTFTYTYDGGGRLIKDEDQLGGYTSLARTDATSGFGWTVAEQTAMGLTSSYQSTLTLPWVQDGTQPESEQRTVIWPDGLQASSSKSLQSGQLTNSVTLPDGTSDSTTLGPDPVWGLQVPVDTSEVLTQGNLTMNIAGSRSTTLGTAGNPFTVSTETDTEAINSRTYTSTFTGSNRTWVNTSPVGRTLTIGLDSLERIANAQIAGLTAKDLTYDSHGRLASSSQGTRKTTFSYNSNGFLAGITDPLKLTTSFAYDGDGHLISTTLPDGRIINYSYDANGNLTSVTPPGESAHAFAYNAVNLPTSYTPPTVPGTGATTYAYDLDRDLTTVTRPDGQTINYGYDTAGRLISIGTPTGTTSFTYNSTTGNVASAAKGTEHIAYTYNGPLPTKSTWKGTVAGSVSRNYNDNFWVSSQSVGGGSNVVFQYDNDGLTTKAGSLVIKHNSKNGLITGTTLGVATDSRTYNSFGELTGYTASANGTAVYSLQYTRDADGRVTAKTETVNGTSNTYSYTYDLAGRLTAVTKNTATDTYTYDTNSNRLSATTPSGTVNGTYDAQDRLLTYGSASYTYTANGELASQTVGTQKTTYKYDVLGNLIAATLPNGNQIAYIIDGENHRIGKQVNGALQAGFLYDGDQVVAQLNASNQVVSQFVYGTKSTSPDYMISGGVTYRIFSDQLGSPVLVVNTSTGAIAEQIAYDEFGNVISDTSSGFQPFGFASGLYDQDTKLVRFGARDYNPSVGRWNAKDPIRFGGGDTNLYGYVLDDPVNKADSSGLDDGGVPWDDIGSVLTGVGLKSVENMAGGTVGQVAGWAGEGVNVGNAFLNGFRIGFWASQYVSLEQNEPGAGTPGPIDPTPPNPTPTRGAPSAGTPSPCETSLPWVIWVGGLR